MKWWKSIFGKSEIIQHNKLISRKLYHTVGHTFFHRRLSRLVSGKLKCCYRFLIKNSWRMAYRKKTAPLSLTKIACRQTGSMTLIDFRKCQRGPWQTCVKYQPPFDLRTTRNHPKKTRQFSHFRYYVRGQPRWLTSDDIQKVDILCVPEVRWSYSEVNDAHCLYTRQW